MKELNIIQTRLVAAKNATNSFGNYKYRSLESIMESLKPLLIETECTITFSDDLVCINDRIFVKSTATLKNKNGEIESSTAFAELDNHKGMSKEQSTGSSSSYARKYAACSLMAIDDNQDIDSMDNRSEEENKPTQTQTIAYTLRANPVEEPKAYEVNNAVVEDAYNPDLTIPEQIKAFCKTKKVEKGVDLKELSAFFKFYSDRADNWRYKKFDGERLWNSWMARVAS